MTPAFLEFFDRLSQGHSELLQHLEQHGRLRGLTVADLGAAYV